jgi:glucose-1-phosphate cytidylyltransferase
MLTKMWLVIFAGGKGSRLGSSKQKPKPLVSVGENPIIWEIISLYKKAGVSRFLICLGFGAPAIKKFFVEKITGHKTKLNLKGNLELHDTADGCQYILANTGVNAETGTRLAKVISMITSPSFFLTYADGLSDVSIEKLYDFHSTHQNKLSLLTIQPEFQYGVLQLRNDGGVVSFIEKPRSPYWINAGFFVIEKEALIPFLKKDCNLSFEKDILPKVVAQGFTGAYKYKGFWGSVDTQKDLQILREKWSLTLR